MKLIKRITFFFITCFITASCVAQVAQSHSLKTVYYEGSAGYSQAAGIECHSKACERNKNCQQRGVLNIVSNPNGEGKVSRHKLNNCDERAEVRVIGKKSNPTTKLNETQWYVWSYYVPSNFDFNAEPEWNIVAQWPCYPCIHKTCSGAGSDLITHKKEGIQNAGEWNFKLARSDGKSGTDCQRYDLGDVAKGVWITFVMKINWTGNSNGFLTIWKNNQKQVNESKLRTYWSDEDEPPYWKVGLYKGDPWKGSAPKTIYTDNIKFYDNNSSLQDVCPSCE